MSSKVKINASFNIVQQYNVYEAHYYELKSYLRFVLSQLRIFISCHQQNCAQKRGPAVL